MFECVICNKTYKNINSLRTHKYKYHKNGLDKDNIFCIYMILNNKLRKIGHIDGVFDFVE